MRPAAVLVVPLLLAPLVREARAAPTRKVTFEQALGSARRHAPDLAEARARRAVASSEVSVAGVLPNPSVGVGTSTQAARLSVEASVPLVVLGQRGRAVDAARADETVAVLDGHAVWSDVRRAAARAYTELWLSERTAEAEDELVEIAKRVERIVKTRVETGSAPELDALRATATRLRAETDANVAHRDVEAAAGGLARWMGVSDRGDLRTSGAPPAKDPAPRLAVLLARVDANPGVRRERASAAAARARASSERAQARPVIVLGVGADAFDPSLPTTNYRAMLSVDVPILDARGAFADREMARAGVASARAHTVRADAVAELTASYRRFQAARSLHQSLTSAVVPAATKAASAAEEAYAVGRVALVDVLDAEKALIDARVEAHRARAAESEAWADVVHALGDG